MVFAHDGLLTRKVLVDVRLGSNADLCEVSDAHQHGIVSMHLENGSSY